MRVRRTPPPSALNSSDRTCSPPCDKKWRCAYGKLRKREATANRTWQEDNHTQKTLHLNCMHWIYTFSTRNGDAGLFSVPSFSPWVAVQWPVWLGASAEPHSPPPSPEPPGYCRTEALLATVSYHRQWYWLSAHKDTSMHFKPEDTVKLSTRSYKWGATTTTLGEVFWCCLILDRCRVRMQLS